MISRAAAFITGEGNWLPLAMALAAATVLIVWVRHRHVPHRDRVQEAMNVFVGAMLVIMGIGHLLAVTTKQLQGTLNGSPALLVVIGVAIVVPALMLVLHANRATAPALNAWMALTLVVLGLVNIPLALPALLNIAYSKHSRAAAGSVIVAAALLVHLGLFAGGVMFMLSGARTFEEFTR